VVREFEGTRLVNTKVIILPGSLARWVLKKVKEGEGSSVQSEG